jgi:hypothetical protein
MHHYCVGDKIESEVGEACSADGGGERRVHGFGGETWDPDVDVGIILRWIFKK